MSKDNEIEIGPELWSAQFKFMQDGDDCDVSNNMQELDIKVEDGGAGKYLVLRTERWAFSSIDELKTLIDPVTAVFGEGWDA